MIKLIIFCFIFSIDSFSSQEKHPKGWLGLSKIELSQEWRQKHSSKYASVLAHLDGDKKTDFVSLIVSEDKKKFGIYVRSGNGKIKEIIHEDKYEFLGWYGIEIHTRRKFKTACGKGYFDCQKGEPDELVLSTDSIKFFKDESAASVFWWNPKTKKFVRTWISD